MNRVEGVEYMDDNVNDDIFASKWKPIHEKTIIKYVLLESLIYFLMMALVTIIFLWIYPNISIHNQTLNEDGIYYVITLNAITFIIFLMWKLISWYKGETRYRKIMNQDV